jgi:SAM-dependent methyltransferase
MRALTSEWKQDTGRQSMYDRPDFWHPDRFRGLEEARASVTRRWLPADVESVLEVGCGNGVFANSLPKKSSAAAIDVALTPLLQVKARKAQASIESIPFPAGEFDATARLEVLEHLEDGAYRRGLAEMARVSRRYVLVSVPYCENLRATRLVCPACGARFHASHHLRSFDYSTISQLFADSNSGFELQRASPIFPVRRPMPLPGLSAVKSFASTLSFPPLTVCPRCGYQRQTELGGPTGAGRRDAESLIWRSRRLVKRIWPSYQSHRWWLALYRRSGD